MAHSGAESQRYIYLPLSPTPFNEEIDVWFCCPPAPQYGGQHQQAATGNRSRGDGDVGRAKAAGSTHVPLPKTTTAASLHTTARSNHFRPSSSTATQTAVELLGAATHGEGVCMSLGYRATSTSGKEKRSWIQSQGQGLGYRVRVRVLLLIAFI